MLFCLFFFPNISIQNSWILSTSMTSSTSQHFLHCSSSSVPSQRQRVVFLPVGTPWRPDHIVVPMPLTHATVLSTGSRLSPQLTVLHYGLADPVDAWIASDGFVHGIHHDDFVVQIRGILTNPVWVQHTKSASQSTCKPKKWKKLQEFLRKSRVSPTR